MTAMPTRVAHAVMVAPVQLMLLLVIGLPSLWVLWLCLHTTSFGQAPVFVGFANYATVLADPYFRHALVNTFVVVNVVVYVELVAALAMATLFASGVPFVIACLAKSRALADRMAWPPTQQLMPGGCVDGRHLTDYGRFSDPGHPAVAVTVECGTHDAAASAGVALEAARRFLDVVQGRVPARPNASIERFRTKEPCVALTDRFVLRVPSTGFVAVRKGEVVAMDGDRPVEAPVDLLIVFPRPDPKAGQTAFLWCERC